MSKSNQLADLASKGIRKDSDTGAAQMPVGTTAQQPADSEGLIRYNVDIDRFEGNNGADWTSLGGASGGAGDAVFYLNSNTVTADFTVPAGQNAISAGPITINDGVTVTIADGAVWVIV